MEEKDNTWLKKDLAGLAYVIRRKCVCLSLPLAFKWLVILLSLWQIRPAGR